MDEQTKYERFFVRSSMVLEKRGTISEEENRLFFSSFCMTKRKIFAHFIFIKWVGGVCVKQIDTIQRG
ncbi:hypothetical protein NGA86_12435 [Lactococcus lactis]|nr:hypothetical protein [Lactococcus lactis]